ncbi:hypothetical protein LCGC14_0569780 [marine sediment metagenome]|uniref:Uncharacterized protein n=1 Tax=marine sediment metagenome TaxID=412755 RepID=A0A0F9U5T0_9ZZZZ
MRLEVQGKMVKELSVLFKGDILKVISRIQKHSGVKKRADVVRDALKLYDELDSISTQEGKIRVYAGRTGKILMLPRKC